MSPLRDRLIAVLSSSIDDLEDGSVGAVVDRVLDAMLEPTSAAVSQAESVWRIKWGAWKLGVRFMPYQVVEEAYLDVIRAVKDGK